MLCPSKPNSRRRGGGWEWDGTGAHGASERRMYAAVVKTSMIGPTCLVHSFLRAAGKWPHPHPSDCSVKSCKNGRFRCFVRTKQRG